MRKTGTVARWSAGYEYDDGSYHPTEKLTPGFPPENVPMTRTSSGPFLSYTLIKQDFDRAWSKVDVVLTPATPSPAFAPGEITDPVQMYLNDVFTVTVNMAGLPGISVPGGLSEQGLPMGLQLIGKPFDEKTLFQVGYAIEEAAGKFESPKWW